MKDNKINSICVVGAGNMGHQIAILAALAGFKTNCTDRDPDVLARAKTFASGYLSDRVKKGKLSPEAAEQALANLTFPQSLEEAAREVDFVIEAAVENLEIKRQLFADLDRIAPRHAILITNSSYIVSSKIAGSTTRPDKVCNMHFFNPALVIKLVEIVQGPHTSEETCQATVDLCKKLGKVPVLLKQEIYGFLVNRILTAIKQEALFLADIGIATPEDIDLAVVNALGHPMGPFRLMDLTGIDLAYHIAMEKYRDSHDPKDKPSPILVEKVVKGDLGKKTGKGFYVYENS